MAQRKGKIFYIDTNIALDYATQRNPDTIFTIEKIKEKKWKLTSSSFMLMEFFDYKKDAIFISRALDKKWETRKILREVNNKKGKSLKESDYNSIEEWSVEFKQKVKKLDFYDFLQDSEDWELAQRISLTSELSAPDVIHLTSAILGFRNKKCDFFVTNDELLREEGRKILKHMDVSIFDEFKILTMADVKKKFFSRS